jgi:5-methylcytosine-specific restriction endonuclease McrA
VCGGRCEMMSVPTHRPSFLPSKREKDRAHWHTRVDKEEHRFYNSKAWIALRDIKLCDDPYCEECLKQGVHTAATHVHHKEEVKARPDLALDMDNLVSLCMSCHSRVHASVKETN